MRPPLFTNWDYDIMWFAIFTYSFVRKFSAMRDKPRYLGELFCPNETTWGRNINPRVQNFKNYFKTLLNNFVNKHSISSNCEEYFNAENIINDVKSFVTQ